MSNPLLLDIITYLKAQRIVTDDGVDAFRDFCPENPDSVTVLSEYKGDPVFPGEDMVNRSIQVICRDKNPDVARQRALNIFNALKTDTQRVDFTNERWGLVYLRQTPFKIKTDELDRITYGFNIGVSTTNI